MWGKKLKEKSDGPWEKARGHQENSARCEKSFGGFCKARKIGLGSRMVPRKGPEDTPAPLFKAGLRRGIHPGEEVVHVLKRISGDLSTTFEIHDVPPRSARKREHRHDHVLKMPGGAFFRVQATTLVVFKEGGSMLNWRGPRLN